MNEAERYTIVSLTGLKLPKIATMAYVQFLMESYRMTGFELFLLRASAFTEAHRDELLRDIEEDAKRSKDTAFWREQHSDRLDRFFSFKYHERLITEMIVCRVTDNFLVYLKQLMASIYQTRPETLRSSGQERLDYILQYSTMDDLVSALAEKHVEEASYRGMRELAEQFERLGLELFTSTEAMDSAVRVIEVRNLLVHNRGIVNSMFKRKVADYPAEIGEHIHVDYDIAGEYALLFANSVAEIDVRASEKFDLPRVPLGHVSREPALEEDDSFPEP